MEQVIENFPDISEQELAFLEQLTLEGDDLPKSLKMLPQESLEDYAKFLYYLFLGSKRTIIATCNRFRPAGTAPYGSDGKRVNSMTKNLQRDKAPTTVAPQYFHLCTTANYNLWKSRAREWDEFISVRLMDSLKTSLLGAAGEAIDRLRHEQEHSGKSSVRVLAAKTLLSTAMPRNVRVEHSLDEKSVKQLSDAQLYEIHRNELAQLPAPIEMPAFEVPVIKRKEEDVIDADVLTDDSETQIHSMEDLAKFAASFTPFGEDDGNTTSNS